MNPLIAAALAAALLMHHDHRIQAAPFVVGETLEYSGSYRVLFAPVGVGRIATLSVSAIDTVDGTPCWKFSFLTNFSIPLYHNHSALISWTTVGDFLSRRFDDRVEETGYSRHREFRIFPDSGFYRAVGDTETYRTPRQPLDDVAFFYFLRLPTTLLEIGKVYSLDRYFRGDRNPVVITVLRREACDLPDDVRAQCLVLNPIVEDPPHGMFMRAKNAELWLTDDYRRIPVRIKSGPYTLQLKSIAGSH